MIKIKITMGIIMELTSITKIVIIIHTNKRVKINYKIH